MSGRRPRGAFRAGAPRVQPPAPRTLSVLDEIRTFGGFLAGVPAFVRSRMTLEQAKAVLLQRLSQREANFLASVSRGVYANPRSPYLALLRRAGCAEADLRQSVRNCGLEDTLRRLRAEGVYVTFEEFKGHRPIVRGGTEMPPSSGDFDNPAIRRYYSVATGGSTGAPRRVLLDVAYLRARVPQQAIMDHVHGLLGVRHVQWAEIPPGHGMDAVLARVPLGNTPERWFTPVWRGRDAPAARYRLATRAVLGAARAAGARVPWPEFLPLDRADVIVRWAESVLRTGAKCGIRAHVSKALRVALAARELGVDLTGATITTGGEPPTAAKVRQLRESGARVVANYFFTEAGAIGFGCTSSEDPNDQHLMMDHLAMIPGRREVPAFDVSVDAFYYTTLLPTAPKLLLNVETDDYGTVERRPCGCVLGAMGFDTHIAEIRSFSKLTGEGVTLIGSDMERILDSDLPARFGGTALDYQLVEEEDERGFTRLTLLVHPRVELTDADAVVAVVLESLRKTGGAAEVSRMVWSQAGTLRVKREAPRLTARGKLLPLHARRRTPSAQDRAPAPRDS